MDSLGSQAASNNKGDGDEVECDDEDISEYEIV